MSETLILSSLQCNQKINRIAHQINETYHDLDEVVIVGIANRGFELAKILTKILEEFVEFKIQLASLTLDKDEPLKTTPTLSIDQAQLKGKSVVLIDDVLNSGKTLVYALGNLLQSEPENIKTVTLVDRRHRKYPVKADFVGLTLSTTLKEHISVQFKETGMQVYLR